MFRKRVIILLISLCLLCSGISGIVSYAIGHSDGYTQGNTNGYTQGYTDGYSQGYTSEYNRWQQWLEQGCFTYPFLLLDSTQYMACHR